MYSITYICKNDELITEVFDSLPQVNERYAFLYSLENVIAITKPKRQPAFLN